jgi:hypothetical protein
MDTRFKVGQNVVSQVSAQGLKAGQVYEVANVASQRTAFGGFTTYTVKDSQGTEFSVGNGHLILSEAYMRADWSMDAVIAGCTAQMRAQKF